MTKKVILLNALRLGTIGITLASLIFLTHFISFLLAGMIHVFLKGNIIYSSFYSDYLIETGKTEEVEKIEELLRQGGPGMHFISALIAGVVFGTILYFIKSFF
jgi:hypothetical protein